MAKVKSLVLAGKTANLPHSEHGSRLIHFDESGLSYVLVPVKDKKPRREDVTKKEAEALLEHYNQGFGMELV